MNIIIRELKANMKSLLIWSVSMVSIYAIAYIEFEAFRGNEEMINVLDSMPEGLMAAFGMANANVTTLSGFTSMLAIYILLPYAIHATLLGNGILAKEERDKTAEFLMTLPVSRTKVIISKWVSSVITSILFLILGLGSILIIVQKYEPTIEFLEFFGELVIAVFIIQFLFIAVGMFFSSVMSYHKQSSLTSISVVVGLYFVSIFSGLHEKLDFLEYFTPFEYFEAGKILSDGIHLGYMLLTIGLSTVLLLIGFMYYPKRDLRI
jgi:ABC-2 type transport system permease protein